MSLRVELSDEEARVVLEVFALTDATPFDDRWIMEGARAKIVKAQVRAEQKERTAARKARQHGDV